MTNTNSTYIRMIPNLAAHSKGFQRVWHASVRVWINLRSGSGLDLYLLKRREESFLFENFTELGLISPVRNQLFHESSIQGSLRIIHMIFMIRKHIYVLLHLGSFQKKIYWQNLNLLQHCTELSNVTMKISFFQDKICVI